MARDVFSAVRREAASHWADRERDEMQRGNYNLKESLVTDHEDKIETLEPGNEENPGVTAEISSLKDYAAAIAGASLEDKPADVAQIFGDAVRQRMADYVSEYAAAINEEGFGYGPEEDEFPVEDYPEDEEPEDEDSLTEKKWIAGAIKHPGREKRAAARAGESTHDYEEQHKDAPGSAGKAARLGLELARFRKK